MDPKSETPCRKKYHSLLDSKSVIVVVFFYVIFQNNVSNEFVELLV